MTSNIFKLLTKDFQPAYRNVAICTVNYKALLKTNFVILLFDDHNYSVEYQLREKRVKWSNIRKDKVVH